MKETKLFELVTGTEMKPWLSRNMLSNINTCENGWSNFSTHIRVVFLKLLEITQFVWPNLSNYLNFLCAVPRDDVIKSTRFLMRPSVIIPPWCSFGVNYLGLWHTAITIKCWETKNLKVRFTIYFSKLLRSWVIRIHNLNLFSHRYDALLKFSF